jgi:hypothetical protein
MPSNRSNAERGKAFDIDTKIEYMNKLYEVRESNQCCDCSLATKDFHKAINVIFGVRKHNLMCAQDMIRIFRAKYDKEKRDYIHAVLNNNSIN